MAASTACATCSGVVSLARNHLVNFQRNPSSACSGMEWSTSTESPAYTTIIEEVQRKVFNSLTNVDGAIKNGKTLYYISQKIPQIFKNLQTASMLAAGKPYLVTIATEHANIIVQRVIKLQTHLQDFVLKDDSKTLINPTDRDKLVYEVYQNINIIYSLSTAMVSRFELYNLQDAVNKVVPYRMYINVDKIIIKDIAKKLKF